jgi:DNA-binding NtrC family response regulator
MHTCSVLIIDDDRILLDTLASSLRLHCPGARIETMESALTSLQRIRSMTEAVIVCDAHQPRMEGVPFVRGVRKLHADLPVLLLIEKHDQDFIRQAMKAGAYDVLVKPVDEGLFQLAVQRALEAARLRGEVKREEENLLVRVRNLMKDLAVLYGAHGLQSHFDAFMDSVEAERAK